MACAFSEAGPPLSSAVTACWHEIRTWSAPEAEAWACAAVGRMSRIGSHGVIKWPCPYSGVEHRIGGVIPSRTGASATRFRPHHLTLEIQPCVTRSLCRKDCLPFRGNDEISL